MSSREIALWVDERWYQALSRQLKDETVEDKLNNYLDELISQLPDHTREKISREIWEEDQQREQEIRARRTASHNTSRWTALFGCWRLPDISGSV